MDNVQTNRQTGIHATRIQREIAGNVNTCKNYSESEYMANDKQADRKKVQLVFDSECLVIPTLAN